MSGMGLQEMKKAMSASTKNITHLEIFNRNLGEWAELAIGNQNKL